MKSNTTLFFYLHEFQVSSFALATYQKFEFTELEYYLELDFMELED